MLLMIRSGIGVGCVLALVACGVSQSPGGLEGKGDGVGGRVHELESRQIEGESEIPVVVAPGDTIVLKLRNGEDTGWRHADDVIVPHPEVDCINDTDCTGWDVFTIKPTASATMQFEYYNNDDQLQPSAVLTLKITVGDTSPDPTSLPFEENIQACEAKPNVESAAQCIRGVLKERLDEETAYFVPDLAPQNDEDLAAYGIQFCNFIDKGTNDNPAINGAECRLRYYRAIADVVQAAKPAELWSRTPQNDCTNPATSCLEQPEDGPLGAAVAALAGKMVDNGAYEELAVAISDGLEATGRGLDVDRKLCEALAGAAVSANQCRVHLASVRYSLLVDASESVVPSSSF